MKTLALTAAAAVSLLGPYLNPAPAVAADAEPQLYRVELVVFVDTSAGAGAQEAWPQPQGLAYPERWKILDADPVTASDPVIGEFSQEAGERAPATGGPDTVTAESTQGMADPGTGAPAQAAQPGGIEPEADTGSLAWQSLPESDWRLADSAARLNNSGRYQVVLHQAWLQPIGNRGQAESLVLAGGERFGDHHELEGYLTLNQERYLHVAAEFWLSRFRFGSGLEATLFSPLPTPPQHDRQPLWKQSWFGDEQSAQPGPGGSPAGDGGAGNSAGSSAGNSAADAQQGFDSGARFGNGAGFNSESGYGESGYGGGSGFDNQYVPSQIFVLKQNQRVDAGQLIYIDHPLMGALLLVTPVESEE